MLAWRPLIEEEDRRLIRSDSQSWCAPFYEGSHRYPKEWLASRYDWVTEEKGAMRPRWEECSKGVVDEEFADASYHGPEGSKVKLSCWKDTALDAGEEEACIVVDCDEEDIDAKLAKELYEQAKIRRRNQLLDEMVTGVKGKHAAGGKGKDKDKKTFRTKRALARRLVRKSLEEWRKQQAEDLKVYSRRQLLESLIPEAGGGNKRPKLKKTEGEGKAKSKARHSNIKQDLCGADPGK